MSRMCNRITVVILHLLDFSDSFLMAQAAYLSPESKVRGISFVRPEGTCASWQQGFTSADQVHSNGRGSPLCVSMQLQMPSLELGRVQRVHPALQLLARQLGEPVLDLVDP